MNYVYLLFWDREALNEIEPEVHDVLAVFKYEHEADAAALMREAKKTDRHSTYSVEAWEVEEL